MIGAGLFIINGYGIYADYKEKSVFFRVIRVQYLILALLRLR